MTEAQQQEWARLTLMGYRPVTMRAPIHGSVRVVVARKLGVGALHLLIAPDGSLSPEHQRDRQLTIER